jgi:hypothetical protein
MERSSSDQARFEGIDAVCPKTTEGIFMDMPWSVCGKLHKVTLWKRELPPLKLLWHRTAEPPRLVLHSPEIGHFDECRVGAQSQVANPNRGWINSETPAQVGSRWGNILDGLTVTAGSIRLDDWLLPSSAPVC